MDFASHGEANRCHSRDRLRNDRYCPTRVAPCRSDHHPGAMALTVVANPLHSHRSSDHLIMQAVDVEADFRANRNRASE